MIGYNIKDINKFISKILLFESENIIYYSMNFKQVLNL